MPTTTTDTSVTKAEVLAAVSTSIRQDRAVSDRVRVHGLTKADVMHVIADKRGLTNGELSRGYTSRASVLRRYVSASAVQRHLDELVADGEAYAVPGTHWAVSRQHGTMGNATYYLSPEARTEIIQQRNQREADGFAVRAMEAAKERVLAEHAAEVNAYFDATMATHKRVDTSLVW